MTWICITLYLLAGLSHLDYLMKIRSLQAILIDSLLEGREAGQAHQQNKINGWLWIILFWPAVFAYNLIRDMR